MRERKETDHRTADGRGNRREIPEKNKKKKEGLFCAADKKCGGCRFLKVPYQEQLQRKQEWVEKLLRPYCKVFPITGMEQPLHYRNKVHAVFDRSRDGKIISGIYQEGTHRVVPVDSCLIEDEKADAIIRDIRGLLRSFRIKTYDEDTGYGLLRHVLVRTGRRTGQIMVVLVLGSPILPSKNNFVKALLLSPAHTFVTGKIFIFIIHDISHCVSSYGISIL